MAFKLEVIGFKELEQNLGALRREMVSPEAGIAEALDSGAWVIALQARDNAVEQGLFLTGNLIDNIKPRKINQFRVDVEVKVVYGAVHEFGLENQLITDRQRRFFWAMWARDGDEMWKALALSTTYTIPARPYLRPAVDTRKLDAVKAASDELANRIQKTAKFKSTNQ